MQSWGYQARFTIRETGLEPTKSGVIGLIAAALGRNRDESTWAFPTLEEMIRLEMAVRVDRPGQLSRDYQTAKGTPYYVYGYDSSGNLIRKLEKPKGFPTANRTYRSEKQRTAICEKYYLDDASFLVGLSGDDDVLKVIADAVKDPAWPLCLGRKCCSPNVPVFVDLINKPLLKAIKSQPIKLRKYEKIKKVKLVVESDFGMLKQDVPISFEKRIFRGRRVSVVLWEIPEQLKEVSNVSI